MTSTLAYPTYFPQLRAFTSTSTTVWDLKDMINSVSSSFKDSTILGSFAANHDSAFPLSILAVLVQQVQRLIRCLPAYAV